MGHTHQNLPMPSLPNLGGKITGFTTVGWWTGCTRHSPWRRSGQIWFSKPLTKIAHHSPHLAWNLFPVLLHRILTPTPTLNMITRERKGNGCTRKTKKKKTKKKKKPRKKKKSSSTIKIDIICIYFLGWYKIRPGRCWLPAVPFPWEESGASALKGVWDGGEFALSPGWIWLYQYLSTMCIYINVNSFIRIIGTRWCRPPFSYRTPVPVLITWEESGASALLELGAGAAAIWDMAQGINLPLIIHLRT